MTSRVVPLTDQLEPVTRQYTMATSLTDTGGRRMREQKSFGSEDTPTLPGARFRVHDGTRPQPRIVSPGTANTPEHTGTPLRRCGSLALGLRDRRCGRLLHHPTAWRIHALPRREPLSCI